MLDEKTSPGVIFVVPCFNEAARLRPDQLLRLVQEVGAELIVVDDGSTDETCEVLARFCREAGSRATLLELERNVGKAEAIRSGVVQALHREPAFVGYFDADLATPVEELARLVEEIRAGQAQVVLGSRVALVGKSIERSQLRHLLGRAFATAASLSLDLVIYDTQCGAKLFRNSQTLQGAFDRPFRSNWAFDVELLGRLLYPEEQGLAPIAESQIVELPLDVWRDRGKSKVRPRGMLKAAFDVVRLGFELRKRASWQKGG